MHKQLLQKYDPTGKRRALVDQDTGVRSGDIIKVTYLDRTNVTGQVIAVKRSVNSVGTNILLRNKMNKLGVEMRIPLLILTLEILKLFTSLRSIYQEESNSTLETLSMMLVMLKIS